MNIDDINDIEQFKKCLLTTYLPIATSIATGYIGRHRTGAHMKWHRNTSRCSIVIDILEKFLKGKKKFVGLSKHEMDAAQLITQPDMPQN